MSTLDTGGPPHGPEPTALGHTVTGHLDNNVAALLAYLPVPPLNIACALLWLATEPRDSAFVRFHSIQSLVFIAANVVFGLLLVVASTVFTWLADAIVGGILAGIMSLGFAVLSLAWIVAIIALTVTAMIKAYQGVLYRMPVVGPWAWRLTTSS
jgi:uncharacterized membrane protein